MKFKYKTHVKVINDNFFAGQTGFVIDYKISEHRDGPARKYLILFSGAPHWFYENDLVEETLAVHYRTYPQ